MLLEDDDLTAPVFAAIAAGSRGRRRLARGARRARSPQYASGEDAYLAARAEDLADLRDRVLAALARRRGRGAGAAGGRGA